MAKRYSAKFKFQVITELLTGDKSTAQVAKAYGVHPNTVNAWKRTFLEKGPEIFAQDNLVTEYERRIGQGRYDRFVDLPAGHLERFEVCVAQTIGAQLVGHEVLGLTAVWRAAETAPGLAEGAQVFLEVAVAHDLADDQAIDDVRARAVTATQDQQQNDRQARKSAVGHLHTPCSRFSP